MESETAVKLYKKKLWCIFYNQKAANMQIIISFCRTFAASIDTL